MQCPKCNRNVPSDAIFCPFCGNNISKENVNDDNTNSTELVISNDAKKFVFSKFCAIAGIIAVFLVLAIGVVMLLYKSNHDSDSNEYNNDYVEETEDKDKAEEADEPETYDSIYSNITNGQPYEVVTFGTYDNKPIEWYILESNGGEAVLLCKDVLFSREYNTNEAIITWEQCSLRDYLNNEFYNTSFSLQEQSAIKYTNLTNEDNQFFGEGGLGRADGGDGDNYPTGGNGENYPAGGNDTRDKVYLLSLAEIEYYWGISANDFNKFYNRIDESWDFGRYCNRKSDNILSASTKWWLRSPGFDSHNVAGVTEEGLVNYSWVQNIENNECGVRPVICVTNPYNVDDYDQSILEAPIGSIVTFGTYEQDNNLTNGPEPIEWYVLDNSGNEVTLLSVYNLDAVPYNEKLIDITWEESTIRQWLNSEFYNKAFNVKEQEIVKSTTLKNCDNPFYGTPGGNDTIDKVFLLSLEEMEIYFGIPMTLETNPYFNKTFPYWGPYAVYCYETDNRLMAKHTEYAIARGLYDGYEYVESDDNGNLNITLTHSSAWWLRSPASISSVATIVDCDGCIGDCYDCEGWGNEGIGAVDSIYVGVRPAIKLGY